MAGAPRVDISLIGYHAECAYHVAVAVCLTTPAALQSLLRSVLNPGPLMTTESSCCRVAGEWTTPNYRRE